MLAETGRIRLYYEKSGEGEPLLLLHGNGEDHHIFDPMIKELGKYFTVYSIDTRGHGKSTQVKELRYREMAVDIYRFIMKLKLDRPILYGFSDGGIIGIMLAAKYPGLLSKLIISGANTTPAGMKRIWHFMFFFIYHITKSNQYKMMLKEPDITRSELRSIQIPVCITAGEKDMIKHNHTEYIHRNIRGSSLKIFSGETHESYIIKNRKMLKYLIKILTE